MTSTSTPRFCSNCGAALNEGARFCHACGAAVVRDDSAQQAAGAAPPPAAGAGPATAPRTHNNLRWIPGWISLCAVIVLVAIQFSSASPSRGASEVQTPLGAARAPDISSMSADEQANRLFDRIMQLVAEGKADSAMFFAPMAVGAIQALAPLDNHRHYDLGLVMLVTDDIAGAQAQADTILASRPNHLLGLSLATRIAEARGDATRVKALRAQMLSSEKSELAAGLPEYVMHDNDVKEALRLAGGGEASGAR